MAKPKISYVCSECGGTTVKWQGKCPHCGAWNTMREFREPTASQSRFAASRRQTSLADGEGVVELSQVQACEVPRILTGIGEFDRVTGGPIVDEYRETTHPGVFACGNVLHVHDLVDFVTLESQTAGEGAARYIKNGGNKEKKYVKTRGINGVRYIVPQKIALGEDEDVKLFFRVGDVHKNAKVVVTYNGETLISKKRPRLAPGEMENVIIKSDMLKNFDENGIIEIQVEE